MSRSPWFSRNTRKPCATPMRSISTICCSRRVRLLCHDAATRETWNRRLGYIMIDEYQDTNRSQYELMRLLTQRARQRLRGGRRGPVDLQLARRRHPQHPRFREGLSQRPRTSAWNRITARPRTSSKPPARWWRTTRSAKANGCGPNPDEGDMLTLYPARDAENEALFIADTIEKILASASRLARRRFCIAPIRSRGRLKKRCGAITGSTTWWAASATTSAPK